VIIARLLADPALIAARSNDALAALAARGIEASLEQLSGGAWEFSAATGNAAALREVIDSQLAPADVLITDHPPILPALFISDMDSTMISAECIDELADYAGIKSLIAAITERAMQGELDFVSALHERVGLLMDLPEAAIGQCLSERINPMPGARVLVQTLRAKGCRTVLVTGGFHQFADPVAEQLGFELVVANSLEIADGKLTGRLNGPICDSATKRATLQSEIARLGAGAKSLATGDGANDIPMLEAANYGMAFCAKPKARAAADGWIDCGDLTAMLRLFNIPEEEWVKGEKQSSSIYPERDDGAPMFFKRLKEEPVPYDNLRTDR
jgi:phosphoserine phosphatase